MANGFKTNVKVNLTGVNSIIRQLGEDAFGLFASQTVHKEYTPSMPMNTGAYSQNITFLPWKYIHNEPYSVYAFYLNQNYRRDLHPAATSNYVEAYSPIAMPKVIKSLNNFIDTRIL